MEYKEALQAGFRDSITGQSARTAAFNDVSFGEAYRQGWELGVAFVRYDLTNVGRENLKLVIDSLTEDTKTVPIPHGTHSVLIVKAEFERESIGKFVKELQNTETLLTTGSFNEIAAFAIGEYGVSVKDIFGDDDESKLSDALLGKITKYRMKNQKENN